MKRFLLILLAFFTIVLYTEDIFTAKVYRMGSNKKEFLFDHYNTIEKQDSLTILTHYYAKADGFVATKDQVILENGIFKQSKSEFFEVNEAGSVMRNRDKMILRFEENGKIKEKEKDFPENLLVGPLFNDHIIQNWNQLIKGEKIYFKLPAPNILQVATFTFEKVQNSGFEKDDHVVYKLDIANFFLRFLVNESYFVYEISSKRLMEIHGTTILRTQQNGKWKNTTDVDIYYDYEKE